MARDIKLAGINFLKVSGEKNPEFTGKPSMKPTLGVESIERVKDTKKEAVNIKFNFGIDYSNLGNVKLEGRMILIMDSKTLKETLKGWEDKKLDNEINLIILNAIMQKASLKALQLEDELGLPPHISIPKLKVSSNK